MALRFKHLRTRLLTWFLVLSLLPLFIAGVILYNQRVAYIKADVFDKLAAIRDLKVGQINGWIDERRGDIGIFSRIAEIQDLDSILRGRASTAKEAETLGILTDILLGIRENYRDYDELFIIDARSGRVAVSTNPSQVGQDLSGSPLLTTPLQRGEIHISDIYESKPANRPTMVFAISVHDRRHRDQTPCGVLVARINLENSIYQLLLNRTGLGNTGETLIVNRDVIALSELRWYERAPLKLKITGVPAILAAEGKTGIAETTDYRGEKVLAAHAYIPRTRWGFVAKMDQREVYAPIRELSLTMFILFAVTVAIVYLVSLLLAHRTAQPILDIAAMAKRIREGDLTARNQVSAEDEIGFLADAFNKAADAIVLRVETEKRNAEIAETLILPKDLQPFARSVLEKLMAMTESQLGAFYVRRGDDRRFEPLAAIGVTPELLQTFDGAILEGEFGKALATGKISHIRDIPPETRFRFKTFTGTAIPREIVTLPVMVKDEVRGIISLASLGGYDETALAILNQPALITLHAAFANLLANDETQRLAEALRETNQELQAQQEELQAQAEELQEQNVELDRQRQSLEEASRLKSQFLSNMSHELRTPLNSVMALSRVLTMQAKGKLSDEEVNYLEIIERNGKNLLALINEILDLAKIEAGRMEISPKPFSLPLTLDNIVESLTPLAAEKGIALRQEIAADLPPLESDEIRVSQILQNLLANAVKFTEAGRVTVTVAREREKVSIAVTDTGIGIAQSDLPYIFDEFRQADGSSSRRYEGTGLGLAIARKAARMLGGDIAVQSAPGRGSTFTLTLPLTWQGQGQEPLCEPIVARKPAGVKPVHRTILVVDDEPEMAAMISRNLLQEGYNTMTAASGSEALALAARERPFAITLDIMMPDMDGWEVLQGLKGNPETQDIPVIIVTAKDLTKEDRARLSGNVFSVLEKSVATTVRLLTEIKRILADLESHRQPTGTQASAAPRILLVEDNEAAIIQVRAVLESAGYAVDVSRGGQEAFAYVCHTVPDGIILDLMMPEVDGFAVLERIRGRKETAELPVLILTAKDLTPEDLKKLSANHIQQLVQKGDVDRQSLLSMVGEMLRGGSGTRAWRSGEDAAGKGGASPDTPERRTTAPAPPPDLPSAGAPAAGSGSPVILIVEDNADNMTTIKAVLQDRYRVLEATDGEAGLRMAAEAMPDLILLDMALPKLDGLAVVRQIRENPALRSIPVLAMTARVMKGDREKILAGGCDDYVAKPIDPADFLKTIAKWLKES